MAEAANDPHCEVPRLLLHSDPETAVVYHSEPMAEAVARKAADVDPKADPKTDLKAVVCLLKAEGEVDSQQVVQSELVSREPHPTSS